MKRILAPADRAAAMLLFTVLSATINSTSAFAVVEKWTLEQTIEHGLQNAPRLQAAAARLRAATLRAENADSGYLPSLDFLANHGVARQLPESVEQPGPYRSNFSLSLTQKIYDNGKTGINAALGQTTQSLSSLQALQAREQFVLDVTNNFYKLSLAKLSLSISEAKLKTVENQLRLLKNHVQQGFRTPRDLMRLDAQAQKVRSIIIDGEARVFNSVAEIIRLAGLEEKLVVSDFALIKPDGKEPILPPLPTLEKTFEARLEKLAHEKSKHALDLLKRQYGPQIFVTAAAGYGASDYMGTGSPVYSRDRLDVSAMVEFKYNLWDGGRERREVGAALAENMAEEATRRDAIADIALKIQGLDIERKRRQASFKTAKQLMTMEEDSYSYLEKAYREGKTSYLDLVTALDNLTQAKLGHASAYFDLLELAARYRYYEGSR